MKWTSCFLWQFQYSTQLLKLNIEKNWETSTCQIISLTLKHSCYDGLFNSFLQFFQLFLQFTLWLLQCMPQDLQLLFFYKYCIVWSAAKNSSNTGVDLKNWRQTWLSTSHWFNQIWCWAGRLLPQSLNDEIEFKKRHQTVEEICRAWWLTVSVDSVLMHLCQ